VQCQKIPTLPPHRRDWNFPGVGLKKCMKLNWNFQRGRSGEDGWEFGRYWAGMNVFWSYSIS